MVMKKWCFFFCCCINFAGSGQEINVLHYRYNLELNDTNDSLSGMAVVNFVLLTDSHSASFDLAGIDQKRKGMNVTSVSLGTYNLQFTHHNDKITIALPANKKGDTLKIWITYKGIPSDGLIISKNKYGDRTFFADNWPNRAHFWIPCKDVPNDKASFEFTVTAPYQYNVISNGTLLETKQLGNGKKLTHWKEDTPLPTKVMVIGAAKFAVKEFPDSPPNIPVSAWVYEQDSTKGFHDYAPAPEILKFFSSYIAVYPYKKLANVQSKTIFGGMENAGAIFYAENSVTGKGGVEDLLAHEIAHQWFGDMASEKSFTHLWLSEGFATYFTDIYWQHKYGDEAFRKRLQKEREEVIQFVKTSNHAVVDSISPYMDLLNPNSYQKGAWVLHMLRNEVGDSIFQNIIRSYYQQYKGTNADTRDFEAVVEKVSGKDMKWFFDQWLYKPGIPQLDFKIKKQKNQKFLSITQKQTSPFKFSIRIGFVIGPNKIMHWKNISIDKTESLISVSDVLTRISIDPEKNLLYEGATSVVVK
jgi:aminopeptidase N